MSPVRKVVFGLGALFAGLLLVLLVVPFFFQDRIASRLHAEIDRSVDARVAWKGASLSLLRGFPNATLSLNGLTIVGVKPFDRDTLVSMRQARLVLDLGSVVRYLASGDRIVVRDITLGAPAVRLRVLADGRANWDIVRKQGSGAGGSSRAVGVTLRNFRISDGRVRMDDEHSRLTAYMTGIQETLSGDFARDRFVLATRTRADSVLLRFAGVPYLDRVALSLDADVDADLARHRFTLRDDSLRLNELALAFAGSVTTGAPDLGLDLTFSTPSTAFHEILSLVPAIYGRDFARLQTAGTMTVSGRVKGSYGPHAFPQLALRARVDNGSFRYPGLPLPANGISMDLAVANPGGHVDSTVVTLNRLHAVIGGRPLDARLVMRTPVSDPDVAIGVTGALNLADLARTVKLDSVSQLAGLVSADVSMHARLSDLDAGRYDRVDAHGTVAAARIALRSAAIPHPVDIDTAALHLTPRAAELTVFTARIGSSDVRATGSLDNLLRYALRNDDLRGSATVSSRHFDLNEWRSKEKTTEVIPVPAHVDFALKASADTVKYAALTLGDVRGNLHVRNQRLTIDSLSMQTLRGKMVASGFYETTVPGRPTFDVDVRLASVDIPSAFAALATVQKLAPVARWAQGSMSGAVGLRGALGSDMAPVFSSLTGKGAIATERLVLQGAPVLDRVASALSLEQMRKPSLGTVKLAFDIADGRLHVSPFTAKVDGIDMTVTGSNGIDQSLSYDLGLAVPGASLGAAAGSAVAKLAARSGVAPSALTDAGVVQLRAKVTGTVSNPSVSANFAGMAGSMREAAQNAVRQAGATRIDSAKRKADSVATEAQRRARAEADRIVADAERQAAAMRTDARALADRTRRQATEHADSLVARAANPVARVAAQAAADRFRREADQQADRIVRDADAKADALVAQAKQRANALVQAPPVSR